MLNRLCISSVMEIIFHFTESTKKYCLRLHAYQLKFSRMKLSEIYASAIRLYVIDKLLKNWSASKLKCRSYHLQGHEDYYCFDIDFMYKKFKINFFEAAEINWTEKYVIFIMTRYTLANTFIVHSPLLYIPLPVIIIIQ